MPEGETEEFELVSEEPSEETALQPTVSEPSSEVSAEADHSVEAKPKVPESETADERGIGGAGA